LKKAIMSNKTRVDPDSFYGELSSSGCEIKTILWPLAELSPRERSVFTEYHYWNTHMRTIAESHRISLGRAYEILYRAEEKVASTRTQEKEEDL
jgi:DNA-directed RNA polymerase specialized sigma24 family protein